MLRQLLGLDSAVNCGGSAVAVVQFLVVIDAPVVLVMTGACAGPDSADDRARRFAPTGAGWSRQFRKLWSPQLVLLLYKVIDVPLWATSWGSRGSAVAVHRLVCQLIMAVMSS